jgi:TolB-like protein
VKDSAGKGRGFWSEIRRRGIVHVTGLYLVAAWLIVQVADTLAQGPLPMPVEALQHIWLALGLIFPIALIFGWRYDITREGIVRTVPHTGGREDRPLRPIDHSIIAGLSLVIAGVLGLTSMEIMEAIEHDRLRAGVGVEEAVGPAPVNSIAVLPFAVCSDQQGDQILAAGLAAEVIDRLASLGTFKVIARASSFTIAGFGLSLRQIAQPLRVKYLLTGELCRDGDRLLLRVELSDDEGYVVWSEVYEQTSDRWDRITVTLAAQVTQGVSGALGHGFTGEPNAPVNRLAYEQLVIGKEYAEQDQFDRARAAFEEALEHEPDYAEAVWELAQLVEWEALSSGDLTLDYLGEAWPLGERALDMARRRVADGGCSSRSASGRSG